MVNENDMGIFEVMYNCRAMRRLSSKEVPEADLLKLIEAAGQAPSGSNTQRRRWIIVRDAEQKKQIAALNRQASAAYVEGRIARGESLPHHDAATRKRMLEAVLWLAEHMQDIHALIVACYEFDAKPSTEERAGVQSSVWPGVQNLLLAARALGLGAVLTTYALRDYDAFANVLNLPDTIGAYALIPVGYPLGKFGPVTRLPVAEVTRFDRWH
ncbi:nitroreductase family protein [Candidatus Entotheonella palauensis]|uniref:Nitroreductase domain-containing protein n=1 Tax=Entotheonella factor TaxID=1429438 RepID=W4LDM4_ENTF1|nr:nitroreductase family protein [Candidatus Entotheonella palauensis]ETW96102.1 MAG: hypothetical protein ETSY1_27960 [Candidatus Entotheonella factor]